MQNASQNYSECAQIPRWKLLNECDEETIKAIGKDYDIPPLYERRMFEQAFKHHYSLARNEHLKCQWREFVSGIETRRISPYQLPDMKELHFHNCAVRFYPPASTAHRTHAYRLRPGPGVDAMGQIPIPHESMMKRGSGKYGTKKMAGKMEEQRTKTQKPQISQAKYKK